MRLFKYIVGLNLALLPLQMAQAGGPRFGINGGVGSTSSTYSNGEPVGGTFSINGATGVAAFNGLTVTSPASPVILYADNTELRMCPSTSGNSNCWRMASGISGTNTDGGITFQHTNNGFASNFTNALILNPTGTVTLGSYLTNFTMLNPSFADGIYISGGNTNASIGALGSDTNVSINYLAKGNGIHNFNNGVVAPSYTVGSTAGVSCAAGSVSTSTMVVTNGIVTHC